MKCLAKNQTGKALIRLQSNLGLNWLSRPFGRQLVFKILENLPMSMLQASIMQIGKTLYLVSTYEPVVHEILVLITCVKLIFNFLHAG